MTLLRTESKGNTDENITEIQTLNYFTDF